MTITTTDNRASFAGDGATVAFATGFKFFANSDLVVILVTDSTGAEATQTITTDYTVADAGVDSGGTVTMVTAPAVGETLVIYRDQPYTQGLDLVENDPFPSDSVEDQLDKTVIMTQQNNDNNTRTLRQPEGDTADIARLPAKVDRASKALTFDADGDPTATAFADLPADVTVPANSTDNAFARFDGTAGTAFQNSQTTEDDSGNVTVAGTLTTGGDLTMGGDIDPNGNFIGRDKGADIASADPLVIGTDGDYFDVTGTTGFSTMTVAANRKFTLQFDAALTITHGASLALPGAVNITTAAGDVLEFQSTAANTVVCTGYEKASGTAGRFEGYDTSGAPAVLRGNFTNNGYPSTRYLSGHLDASPSSTVAVTADRLYGCIFHVLERTTFTRICIEVTSGAGTNARLGIYDWASGVPTDLVVDAGTVSTATTGVKEATISQTLMPGVYCTAAVFDNTPTVVAASNLAVLKYAYTGIGTPSGSAQNSFYTSHTFGALPDPFGSLTFASSAGAWIGMRIV